SEPKAAERAPRGGGGTGGGGAVPAAAISIDHGAVAYISHGKAGATSQYRVEDLDLTLTGGAPQLAFKGDFKVKPGDLVVKVADGQVALNGGKSLTEAPLRGVVTLDGKDIGELVKTALGDGTITGQLSLSLAQGMRVQLADLAIKALPLEKALVDYLCQGYAITGPLDLTGATSFSAHDVFNTLSGPGALKIGRGKVVGPRALALLGGIVRLGGAVSSLLSADLPNVGDSPLEFESITGTYQIVNGVLNTKDLLYTSR